MSFIKRIRNKQSASKKKKVKNDNTSNSGLNIQEIKELIVDSSGSVDKNLQRFEAYKERSVQKLLRNLLDSGSKVEIIPTYDISYGFRYKDVETILGEEYNFEKAERLLDRLSELEILRKSFYDSISSCPVCGSTSITSHFRCPACGSHQIYRSGLIEHIPCGTIEDRNKYFLGHAQPTCPKCGQPLVKDKYRDMGLWYICKSCNERFERLNLDLICRKCEANFEIQSAMIKDISKYSLNPEIEQEIRQNVISLESINDLLIKLGFMVKESASAVGEKSGIQHNFSLIAKKELYGREWVVAIDHAVAENEVTASPVILYTYKISEVKVDIPIFIAIPRLSEVAKRIAKGYNIITIEGIPMGTDDLVKLQEEIQRKLTERILMKRAQIDILSEDEEEILQRIIEEGKTIEVVRDKSGKFKKIKKL
ncbi:MAG: TackOD1 domain-containing metal-binding protein [Candidatus Bathyarchaeia archaeon]